MPKVSIIVPVYKVEQYIRECLDSIQQQTLKDWECLLIDDGSPDNSGKICDEYAMKDARFRVFHVDNGGVSRARNIGLDNMLGEWVMFVDSDDAIAYNALETCTKYAEENNLDLLQFSFARSKDALGEGDGVQTSVLGLADYVAARKLLVCAGGSLLRASIIRENSLSFNSSLKLAEDQLFVFEFMNIARRLQKIDNCLYWYRDNPSSATHQLNTEDLIQSMKSLLGFKIKHSIWAPYVDRMNVVFLIRIIINKDLNVGAQTGLVRFADISDYRLVDRGLPTVFCTICRFSKMLAVLVVRFKSCL